MKLSTEIQKTVRKYHLDNPEANWDELKEYLLDRAEDFAATPTVWEYLDSAGLEYEEDLEKLQRIAVEVPMTIPQSRTLVMTGRLLRAAQDRAMGDHTALLSIIDQLEKTPEAPLQTQYKVEEEVPVMTFAELASLYMAEIEANVKPITMRNTRSNCKIISEGLGDINIRTHTRSDLVKLRDALLKARKPASVNQILTHLTSVLAWGVANGHLERSFDKKLKVTKGTESTREALTQDQVKAVMNHTRKMDPMDRLRWALSLGCITGARAGEIRQLRPEDVKEIEGTWFIDINEDSGKDLKNKHSSRLVPLIDGAYGFDLEAFLAFVRSVPSDNTLAGVGYTKFSLNVNGIIREALGLSDDEKRLLTFHSLRHSLASLLKYHGVSAEAAQAILGHSSQTITYDLYGAHAATNVDRLVGALKLAFEIK